MQHATDTREGTPRAKASSMPSLASGEAPALCGAPSLRLELQQEHIDALSREASELREQLAQARAHAAQAEELRAAERSEVVASYERMLAEQQAAVRQYETRAASVGTLRLELQVQVRVFSILEGCQRRVRAHARTHRHGARLLLRGRLWSL